MIKNIHDVFTARYYFRNLLFLASSYFVTLPKTCKLSRMRIQKMRCMDADMGVRYSILDTPPWYECALLGFQVCPNATSRRLQAIRMLVIM
jgi:hypothetical protein